MCGIRICDKVRLKYGDARAVLLGEVSKKLAAPVGLGREIDWAKKFLLTGKIVRIPLGNMKTLSMDMDGLFRDYGRLQGPTCVTVMPIHWPQLKSGSFPLDFQVRDRPFGGEG